MLITFAKNLTLDADVSDDTIVYTDPVPLGGNSRATVIVNIYSIFNATSLIVRTQGSNDGVNFVDDGPAGSFPVDGISIVPTGAMTVSCAYIRMVFHLDGSAAGISSAVFDCYGNFDRS